MPAHDEAFGISDTLRSIVPQLSATDRLLVVADNCSDDTAAVATAEGAEVIARANQTLRGKGYALDFGVRYLAHDAPDIVIVMDADCQVAEGSIDRLARLCAQTSRPIQALYLMRAPEGAGAMARISEFAWMIVNQVRPTGLRRLGLPCKLCGTGMAFPWSCISHATLATSHLVEDLQLGIELAAAGTPPLFCPEARVISYFPASREGAEIQRTRWEHGHLRVILHEAPRLLWRSLHPLNSSLASIALDLSVPPLTLLALQVMVVWIGSLCLYFTAHLLSPLVISSVGIVLFAISVLLSWGSYGRHIISVGTLMLAAGYALRKIPIYAKFLVARQINWVRSERYNDKRTPGSKSEL